MTSTGQAPLDGGRWRPKSEVLGVLPAILLNIGPVRQSGFWLMAGCAMACGGIVLNRFVTSVAFLAIPVLPFENFYAYLPNWWEWGIVLGFLGYAGLLLSLAYRYLPVFPHEHDLNPGSW